MAMLSGALSRRSSRSMKVTVSYMEEVATPFREGFLTQVTEETLRRCPLGGLAQKEEISLNVVAVTPERIRELNKTYREKDAVTDILSFGEYADTDAVERETAPALFLGEIFFCQEVITQAAEEDAVTLEHEMTYVFSHGILHLLGYDHSDEMFALQDAVTEALITHKNKQPPEKKSL